MEAQTSMTGGQRWFAEEDSDLPGGKKFVIRDENRLVVALVQGDRPDEATLIAAAPQLLDALVSVNWASSHGLASIGAPGMLDDLLRIVRTAMHAARARS